jgi:ferrochelatase
MRFYVARRAQHCTRPNQATFLAAMSRFLPEPDYSHDSPSRIGILLINLGTPEAPTASAVRTYLREFLSDPRVVELPRPLWWMILNLFVLPFRPRKSAAKYAAIWDKEGSPLRVHTIRQTKLLAGYLTQGGNPDISVEYAMRYGSPNAESALMRLKARGATRILVLPMYPQYAASTTASAFDAVAKAATRIRNLPELRFVRNFHDHPDYIRALARQIERLWQREGKPDKLVMSFHGLPKACLDRGDPYFCECHKTARLLAAQLYLKPEQYELTFQSRFGRTEWLKPDTESTLRGFPAKGIKKVDVVCPGFVADCLETLEEIALEGKATFLSAGGQSYRYIPALNEEDDFITALRNIALGTMQDWLAIPPPGPAELKARAAAARQLGGH